MLKPLSYDAVNTGFARTAAEVVRLHERLCAERAEPEDADMLQEVEKLLEGFSQRTDLKRHRERLSDTGIAGTTIYYTFFWPTARWLVAHWPAQLSIDWDRVDDDQPLAAALPLLVGPIEAIWLRAVKPPPQEALARLAGRGMTDAAYLVSRVEAMPGDDFMREAFYDRLGPPLILKPGRGTPSRTNARLPGARVHFRSSLPRTGRLNLAAELNRPPLSVRAVSRQKGVAVIDLAREAMVTRARDLDAFAYGDPRDVRLIDDGEGLQWAMIGLVPERRPIFRSAYGFLTLRSGVPVGYVQSDTLWRCVDLSFNTFETFRGKESAWLLGRTMAMLRHLFAANSFTLEPYQLGDGNEEGIESGAWWFYYKLGFRPRSQAIRQLVRTELEKMESNPRHRSSPTILRKLAKDYLYLDRPGARAPNWPRLSALGSRLKHNHHLLLDQFAEAPSRTNSTQKPVLEAWAPVVALLPDLDRWVYEDRRMLIDVILAKGGSRRDTEYLALFNQHPRLAEALWRLVH